MARHSRSGHPAGLYIHKATGRWCKVFKRKCYYLRNVKDDPTGEQSAKLFVLKTHEAEHGIEIPGVSDEGTTVRDIAEAWLQHIQSRVALGQRSQRTLDEYRQTAAMVLEQVGRARLAESMRPQDFAAIKRKFEQRYKSPESIKKRIIQVRSMFNFGFEEEYLEKPVRYGKASFAFPDAKTLRGARQERGRRDFDASEIRAMLAVSNATRRSMILLGINCALGNTDIAQIEVRHVDLESGWLDYPRPKTKVERRCPLWPETVAAIREATEQRPKSPSGLLFVSVNGQDYSDPHLTGWRVGGEFRQVLARMRTAEEKAGKKQSKRETRESAKGRGFYGLRRTFQTVAEDCGDFIAIRAIMGHAEPENDMSSRYRERIADERLRRVVETVHTWLFATEQPKGQ